MSTFDTERFIPTADFDALAERLASLQPDPFHGRVTADQIKIELGEFANVWPESIRPVLIRDELEDRGLIAPECLTI